MAKRLGCQVPYCSNGRVTHVAKFELSPTAAYQLLETKLSARPLAVTSAAINQAGVSIAVAWHFTQQMIPKVVPAWNFPVLRMFSATAEGLPEFLAAPHGDGTYRDIRSA